MATVCTITAEFTDLGGAVPSNIATLAPQIYVKNEKSFMHGNILIGPYENSAAFNTSTGIAQIQCIETTTPGELVQIYVAYNEGTSKRVVYFKPALIPNQSSANLSAITTVQETII